MEGKKGDLSLTAQQKSNQYMYKNVSVSCFCEHRMEKCRALVEPFLERRAPIVLCEEYGVCEQWFLFRDKTLHGAS